MIITDESSLVLNPVWVPHWILFSLGIPCSVDFLSFSNFHIIWTIKFIVGDIWWSACLVFQFGSFLKSSKGNSVVLLRVHCCLYFCQSLGRVFDGSLLQIAQGVGSKYHLCWFTSRILSLGMTRPYFAGQALAVEHSQKLPSLCREQCLTWPPLLSSPPWSQGICWATQSVGLCYNSWWEGTFRKGFPSRFVLHLSYRLVAHRSTLYLNTMWFCTV